MQAKLEIIQRGTATDFLESHKGEWPSEIKVLAIGVHQNATPVEVVLGRYPSGWFGFGAVKTQAAPPQAHMDVVAILDQMKELGALLRIHDDSTYYETRDERRLLAVRDLTTTILAKNKSIARAGPSAMDVRAGRQSLTYQAEMEMTQDRWMLNEGSAAYIVYVGTAAPWETESAIEPAYLQALRDHGIMWVPLPQGGLVSDDFWSTLFDTDPANTALNDFIFGFLDRVEAVAKTAGTIYPVVVFKANGKHEEKLVPRAGQWTSASDAEAARKIVSELGPEVEKWAFVVDAYLTLGGRRGDFIEIEAGERGARWGVAIGQRYIPKGAGQPFQVVGQPIVLGPTTNPLRQDPATITRNSLCVQNEEPTNPSATEPPQVIHVDEAHASGAGSEEPPAYVIKKADSLTLDFRDCFFEMSKIIGKPPNAVHALGQGAVYTKINPGVKTATIRPDNATRFRGGVFRGFRNHGLLAIGWQDEGPIGKIEFVPFWMAWFRIEGMPAPQKPTRTQDGGEGGDSQTTEFERADDAPEVTDTDMRKLNVYFARGTRDHTLPKILEQLANAQPNAPQGAASVPEVTEPTLEEGQVPFIQAEALSWLSNNRNKAALAAERFPTTGDAIEAVKRLYEAGATKVDVVATYNEPSRIARDGGPYADELEVAFPAEGRERLLSSIKELAPDNWRMGGLKLEQAAADNIGSEPETLWWAGV